MDSDFRPFDDHCPAYHSSPTNCTYFTAQAIRAGFTSTDFRRFELQKDRHDLREAVQRELEKERIRAEIIAQDIARRRILEQEVRRELILEREMAMREVEGCSVFGAPSMRHNPWLPSFETSAAEERMRSQPHREVERRGLHRPPTEQRPLDAGVSNVSLHEVESPKDVRKEKFITLVKPNKSLSCLKRKAATPLRASDLEVPSIGLDKKPNREWSCALCRVTATSERGLNEHLKGKKHKANEARLIAQPTGFSTSPSSKMNITGSRKSINVLGNASTSCLKPHVKTDEESSEAKCDNSLEKEKRGSSVNLNDKAEATRLHKGENAVLCDKIDEASQSLKMLTSVNSKNKFRYWCGMCQVGAHSEKVMSAHKRGKKHLKKRLGQLQKAESSRSTNPVQLPREEAEKELHETAKEVQEDRGESTTYVGGDVAGEEVESKNVDGDVAGADSDLVLASCGIDSPSDC
ncbi:hypothetical protein Nepgr_018447 [Nepenthes gracilis]|uniref:U1-type domain-containing protein n=1 Tax=Nepenthes gracilis TaxID=150966 RepID=A0AAD3XUB7_NEPGR|nr:hypothetical protein Nepgr_018447 [Nepenthes gracilis]